MMWYNETLLFEHSNLNHFYNFINEKYFKNVKMFLLLLKLIGIHVNWNAQKNCYGNIYQLHFDFDQKIQS